MLGNSFDLGSWKCGKDKTFTRNPTNFIIFFKINSIKNYLIKRWRISIVFKKFNINRVLEVFPKKRLTLPSNREGVEK